MRFKLKNSNPGTTLLEILIYIALIGLISVSIVMLTVTTINTETKTRGALTLEENVRFALSKITERIHLASDISTPQSGLSSTLTLTMNDPNKNPTTIYINDGKIYITEGVNPSINITSPEIDITGLSFNRLSASPAAVRVEIAGELRNTASRFQSTFQISDTAVIRR